MSNSNFTPETLPSFPSVSSPPVSPLKGGERGKGQTGSDWETGGPDVPCKHERRMCRHTHTNTHTEREQVRESRALTCNKTYDVWLFTLPYTLPCGPPGGKACCF